MNYRFIFILAILFFSTIVSAASPLVLARAPQQSASKTSLTWSPFIEYLSNSIGIKVILKVYKERSDFESDIKNGKVDLYFGNPGYAIVGHLNHGYIPLIRSDRKLLEGIIVAKKNSGIKTIEQLNNTIIAFPDETAFAASLYIRSRLQSDFNIKYQALYTGSHDNTYRTVMIGKASAGGGVKRTLNSEAPKLRDQLQIIYTTPGIRSHPLMAHPKVSKKTRQSIQQAILKLNTNNSGKKLLKDIKLNKPVIASYSRDYFPIEPLVREMYHFLLNKK